MVLGGHVFPQTEDPFEYAELLVKKGFRAGYCPRNLMPDQTQAVRDLKRAFERQGLVMAEVGAWSNPLSLDDATAQKARDYIAQRLALADELGARCCVNVMGTHDANSWGGLHPDNFTEAFYEQAIQMARGIVDAVKPKRTKMTFEITPWSFLDGVDNYLRFVRDVDRDAIGVHLDPINCVTTVGAYVNSTEVFRDAVKRLAPYGICSLHLKDILMLPGKPQVQIEEVRLGLGVVDLPALLQILDTLPKDTPVMLEHLEGDEEYQLAAAEVRKAAQRAGVEL